MQLFINTQCLQNSTKNFIPILSMITDKIQKLVVGSFESQTSKSSQVCVLSGPLAGWASYVKNHPSVSRPASQPDSQEPRITLHLKLLGAPLEHSSSCPGRAGDDGGVWKIQENGPFLALLFFIANPNSTDWWIGWTDRREPAGLADSWLSWPWHWNESQLLLCCSVFFAVVPLSADHLLLLLLLDTWQDPNLWTKGNGEVSPEVVVSVLKRGRLYFWPADDVGRRSMSSTSLTLQVLR